MLYVNVGAINESKTMCIDVMIWLYTLDYMLILKMWDVEKVDLVET